MCGRFTLTVGLGEVVRRFDVDESIPAEHAPRYNIAPTQQVPVITVQGGKKHLIPMRWGLIPRWAKDPAIGNRLINARSETLTQKPAFRRSFLRHRCIVPADGFYEWKGTESGRKQPMRIVLKGETVFGMAGLWDLWQSPEGEKRYSFTIITTRPNDLMRDIHRRMPVILQPDHEAAWLDPEVKDPDFLTELLQPYPSEAMEAYPVSTVVNSPKNDSPECIRPVSVSE